MAMHTKDGGVVVVMIVW